MNLKPLGLLVCAMVVGGCRDHTAQQAAPQFPTATERSETTHTENPTALATAPLPQGARLQDTFALLKARADNGDARAACQLAAELDFCAIAQDQERQMKDIALRTGKKVDSTATQPTLSSSLRELTQMGAEYCADLAPALISPSERVRYWKQAATSGHLPSMLHYASGAVFQEDETLQVLDALQAYKKTALPMMQKVAANGSLDANLLLARAYYPGVKRISSSYWHYINQAVDKKDGSRSLAYYLLSQHLLKEGASSRLGSPHLSVESEIDGSITELKKLLKPEALAQGERSYQTLMAELRTSSDGSVPDLEFGKGDPYPTAPDTARCSKTLFAN